MVAVAALYLPVALAAEALVDPSAAGVDRLGPLADAGGTPGASSSPAPRGC